MPVKTRRRPLLAVAATSTGAGRPNKPSGAEQATELTAYREAHGAPRVSITDEPNLDHRRTESRSPAEPDRKINASSKCRSSSFNAQELLEMCEVFEGWIHASSSFESLCQRGRKVALGVNRSTRCGAEPPNRAHLNHKSVGRQIDGANGGGRQAEGASDRGIGGIMDSTPWEIEGEGPRGIDRRENRQGWGVDGEERTRRGERDEKSEWGGDGIFAVPWLQPA